MTASEKKELKNLEKLVEKISKLAMADIEWYEQPSAPGSYAYHPLYNRRNAVIFAARAFGKEMRK